MLITVDQLRRIVPGCPTSTLERRHPHVLATLERFEITSRLRIAAFVAQTAHESQGYRRTVENLNYSAAGLMATWPKRFTKARALVYARKPERIANLVYANRYGNGDEASGDGWRYRGRGDIQVTFKDNYRACGVVLGLDLVAQPELLELPDYAPMSAGWYWSSKKLNNLADLGDMRGLTLRINGGETGLADRLELYELALAVLAS